MDLTQLRYFLEVAETQHMTLSAQRLHIAQPALTQSIHKLEKIMGVPLFERRGRNIYLTEYGAYLRTQLEPIIKKLDSLPETLQAMAKMRDETVRIGVLAATAIVTRAIIDYKQEHPNVNFKLLQNPQEEFCDIEVTTKMFYQQREELKDSQFVCTEKIYLAVPNNDRYRDISCITLKEVENENFVSLAGMKQFRTICDKFCRHANVHPHFIFESDNPAAVKNMIVANMGIGFWPGFTWGDIDSNEIKLIEIVEPTCSRDVVVTLKRSVYSSAEARSFYDYLKTVCTEKEAAAAQLVAKQNK